MNLVITLSSPRIPFHSLYDFAGVGSVALNPAQRAGRQLCSEPALGAKNSCSNHAGEGSPFTRVTKHLSSIKTSGTQNILSRAEPLIRIFSGFLCWGGREKGGE